MKTNQQKLRILQPSQGPRATPKTVKQSMGEMIKTNLIKFAPAPVKSCLHLQDHQTAWLLEQAA